MSEPVLLQQTDDEVRLITLNRPERFNALNTTLMVQLINALLAADVDEAVRAIVLTGAGTAFCEGADLTEFGERTPVNSRKVSERAAHSARLHGLFRRLKKPVVTAINGSALGGGAGLAIAGDLAVMADSARLGYPQIRHGIVAAIEMTNLVRHVGRKAAFEIVALGESMTATRALSLGMVNQVAPLDETLPAAMAYAEQLATIQPAAMARTKQLFHSVSDLPFDQALETGRAAHEQ